jgi:hypothetical protein
MTTLVLLITLLACSTVEAKASDGPVSREAKRWKPDREWLRGAFCIHRHESVSWTRAGVDWLGRPSPYFGGFQFLDSTWRAAGGSGHASDWAPREQFFRAWIVWKRDGGSWGQWGSRKACGLA